MKTVGGNTKYFVYNGMNIVYEYSESVADGVAYFYGLNRTHNSEGEIYVYNAHGDVVQLVRDNAVVASYTYDAFGNLTSQIGNSENPFLYCGEYFDAETQTYYLRARYYNPANGRFTQQDAWAFMDASDPLSLNLYTYCCNNPVMYVDLTGNWPTFAQIATAVAVVAVGAVLVAATIASAGTVGAVAGAAAATYLGASATAAATVATVATVGTYAVAGGIAATYASDAGEILTGHNVVRDDLMGGNQEAYDIVRTGLNAVAAGAIYVGEAYGSVMTPAQTYEKFANEGTHNNDSNTFVLGKYNTSGTSYDSYAADNGYTYFSLKKWNQVSKAVGNQNMWNINLKFIKNQISMGKNIICTHDPSTATGYYAKEIAYLSKEGYTFVKEGDVWRAIK